MAINYTAIDPSQWETWIPDYKGERDLAATDPESAFSVDLRFMTLAERKRHERVAQRIMRNKISEDEAQRYLHDLFASHVRNVRNYSDGERGITDGPDLLAHLFENGESDLVYEIVGALAKRSALEDGLAKKLRRGSDSGSSHPRISGNGDAADATPQSPPTIQAVTTTGPTCEYQTAPSDESAAATARPKPLSTTGRPT